MNNNKKNFYFALAAILVVLLTVQIIVNIIIDPDMETRIVHGHFNRYKFSHSAYSSVFLANKLKSTPSVLMFGTSRSHIINNEIAKDELLNLHSIYGNPYAVKSFLTQLDKNQIKNIKVAYYLLDDMTFNNQDRFEEVNYTNFFVRALAIIRSTNLNKILRAYGTVKYNYQPIVRYISENGSFIFKTELPIFDPNIKTHMLPEEIVKRWQGYSEDTFLVLKEIDDFCKHNGIKIIYFTPPLTTEYLNRMDYKLYIGQRERFLKNLDGYYDLSYLDQISNDPKYFIDFGHTNLYGAQIFFDILKKEDKKYYMTKEKFDQYKLDIKKFFKE